MNDGLPFLLSQLHLKVELKSLTFVKILFSKDATDAINALMAANKNIKTLRMVDCTF
jgi:hypothetical protein